MKTILTLILGGAALLTAQAGTPVSETVREFTAPGDFNADTFPDVLILDKPTGLYRIGYGAAGGALTFSTSRPSGTAPVEAAALGKLNGTADSFAVTAAALNRLHVLSPAGTGPVLPVPVSLSGIGPAALAALDLPAGAGPTAEDDLLVFSTQDPVSAVQLRQVRSAAGAWSLLRTDDVSNEAPSAANPFAPSSTAAQQMGVLRNAGSTLTFEMLEATGAALTTRASITGLPPGTRWTAGVFQSPRTDLFFHTPGETGVTVRRLFAGAGGTFTAGAAIALTLPSAVEQLLPVNDSTGLRMAVRFTSGAVSIYTYTNAGGFSAPTVLSPTGASGVLAGLVAMPGQSLQLLYASAAGQPSTQALTYTRQAGGWTQTGTTAIAAPDIFDSYGNAFLLSAPLFRGDPSELTQVYHAGDWTNSLTVGASPFAITAQAADFGSSTGGLGASTAVSLGNANATPGGTAANQTHPQFSVFAFQTTLGSVVDDIGISPSPGNYAAAQQITWSGLGAGAAIYYRIGNTGAFTAATGTTGPWIFRDGTVQYYVLSGSTAGPVRSADYLFTVPPVLQDADGDGVPDFVELARGLNPSGGPDHDEDGFTDAEELRAGTNPNLDSSFPAAPAVSTEEAVADARVRLETITGALNVNAPTGTEVSLRLSGRAPAGTIVIGNGGAAANFGRAPLQGVVPGAEFLTAQTADYFDVTGATLQGRQMLAVLPSLEPEAHSYNGTPAGTKTVQTAWSWGGVNWTPGSNFRPRGDVATSLTFATPAGRELTSPLWGSTATGNYSEADWTALYQASVSGNPQPYLNFSLTPVTTVEALIFHEIAVTLLNTRRATGEQLSIGERDATGFESAELLALRTVDPDYPTQPAYRLRSVLLHVNAEVNGADSGSPALRKVARAVYLKHQTLAPEDAGDLATPVSALRQWIRTGSLPSGYLTGFGATTTEVANALARINTCRATVPARPIATFNNMIAAATPTGPLLAMPAAGGAKVVLQSPEGSAAATELAHLFAASTLSALRFSFQAYTDLPIIGGDTGVEVITLNVTGFPLPVGEDTDGDLLADEWEMLHFGTLAYTGSDRRDGSSYTLAQEYFDGTDPTRSTSSPTAPAEAMELSQPEMARTSPTEVRLLVRWPAAYRDRVRIGFSASSTLGMFTDLSGSAAPDNTGLFTQDFITAGLQRHFFKPWVRLRR